MITVPGAVTSGFILPSEVGPKLENPAILQSSCSDVFLVPERLTNSSLEE